MPLRGGILKCAKCGGSLTGSPSTSGSGKRIYYYHCQRKNGCNENFSAVEAHNKLEKIFEGLRPLKSIKVLFSAILTEKYKTHHVEREREVKRLLNAKNAIEENIDILNESFYMTNKGNMDESSYKRIMTKYKNELQEIVIELSKSSDQSNDIRKFIDFGIEVLLNVDMLYKNSRTEIKRRIIRSIFTENLIFENKEYRTPKMNEAVALIFSYNKGLRDIENKKGDSISKVSASVPINEEISKHLVEDLERIVELNNPLM